MERPGQIPAAPPGLATWKVPSPLPDSLDCLPTASSFQLPSLAPGTHCPHCPPIPHLPPDIMLGRGSEPTRPALGILVPALLSEHCVTLAREYTSIGLWVTMGGFLKPANFVSQSVSQLADSPQLNFILHLLFIQFLPILCRGLRGKGLVSMHTNPGLPSISDELFPADKANCCGQKGTEMRGTTLGLCAVGKSVEAPLSSFPPLHTLSALSQS